MKRLLLRPALRIEQDTCDGADVVLVALLTGVWRALEERTAHALRLQRAADDRPSAPQLDDALTQFRYARRLIAAAELSAWLDDRALQLSEVKEFLRRRWLLAHCGDLTCLPGDEVDLVGCAAAEAICSGALAQAARSLLAWNAAASAIGDLTAPPGGGEVEALVRAALASPASALPELGVGELSNRARRIIGLRARYREFSATAVPDAAADARVTERRLEWTTVAGRELVLAHQGAARETRLRVVHDGDALGDVAESLDCEIMPRELEIGGVSGPLAAELLGARIGSLVGPWEEAGSWRVLAVDRRTEPEPGRDDSARRRARGELLHETIDRLLAGRGGVVGAF